MTGWGDTANGGTADIAMVLDGDYYVAADVALAADAEFKFRKNNAWEENYGGGSVDPDMVCTASANGANITVSAAGTYDIYLAAAFDKFYVMTDGKTPDQAGTPEEKPDEWYIGGQSNGWSDSATKMTLEGDWWITTGFDVTGGFKFIKNSNWETTLAAEAAVTPNVEVAAVDGYGKDNIMVSPEGTYDLYLSADNTKFYVMTPGYKPGELQLQKNLKYRKILSSRKNQQ